MKKINKHMILGALLYISIMFLLGDVAFSVRTHHDNIAVILLVAYFVYYIYTESLRDKGCVVLRIKAIYHSAKWLYVAIGVFLLWDMITIFYTKDIFYTLKKLPYLLEFLGVAAIAVYFLQTKRRINMMVLSVFLSGVFVAVGSYFYYAFSIAPIYFKRLSTARDYNVFASLLLISLLFGFDYLSCRLNTTRLRRFLLYVASAILIIPAFYYAGSRRMAIMLPYFLAIAVLYEVCRLVFAGKKGKARHPLSLGFIAVTIPIYIVCVALLPSFTEIGVKKEADYRQYVEDMQNNPDNDMQNLPKPPNTNNETTIIEVLETIEDKTLYSKRNLIYAVAFDELAGYNFGELLVGRGASYDMYMYHTTQDKALLDAYSISEKNPRVKPWLYVHNFVLSDILNGGVIKMLLGLFMLGQFIRYAIKAIRLTPKMGVMVILVTSAVVVNNFISGPYGFFNDIFFYAILITIAAHLSVDRRTTTDFVARLSKYSN